MSKARSNLREAVSQFLFSEHSKEYNLETVDLDRMCARVEMSIEEDMLEQNPEKSEYGKMAERMDARYDNQH